MRVKTDEFTFILKPSVHGIGVFATQDITKGAYLRLFGTGDRLKDRSVLRNKKDVPKVFWDYCMHRDGQIVAPKDFGQMAIGWYLNHSKKPNAVHKKFSWYANRDIRQGEEILINYNSLDEPEKFKENYY